MAGEKTCGHGLASHAPLLEGLSQVVHAMASVLNAHLPILDMSDPASERERKVYVELIELQRRAGHFLTDAARRMTAARDLPMGRHIPPDEAEMTKMRENYARFVIEESQLLDLLAMRTEPDRQMLEAMG